MFCCSTSLRVHVHVYQWFKAVENLQNNDIHMDTRYILIFIYPTWYNLTDLFIYHLVTELVTEDVYLSLI